MPGNNHQYIGRSAAAATGVDPSLLTNPNGAYGSAPWSLTNLTETTGQTDPLGGSTASLLTDNITSGFHSFQQTNATPTGLALLTCYFKPGTYTGGITLTDTSVWALSVSNAGALVTVTNVSGPVVVSVGGFFKVTGYVVNTSAPYTLRFGSANVAYAGTTQTQTFWGMALQQVF